MKTRVGNIGATCARTLAALAISASTAHATITNFTMTIDGLQETPPVATPASGSGTASYDDSTGTFSWNVTYSGLIGAVTAAHFHGPAAPGVGPAGIQVPIPSPISPMIDSAVITPAQAADLLDELWYVNIHSSFRPGGEIRGQVMIVPEPASLTLLGLGALVGLRRR